MFRRENIPYFLKLISDGWQNAAETDFGDVDDYTEVISFVPSIIDELIEKVLPEKQKPLTLKKAGKCLGKLGKIWNLSEYPPNNLETTGKSPEERLMDMEGYVDEYQYLHIEAVDLDLTDIRIIPRNFVWLISADLSGNRLTNTSACPITKLPNLVVLKLNRNRFEDPYMPPMKHLQYLGLNSNKIESLHRIYHPNLETLDLNYNEIKEVKAEDCWKHTKLMQLELRGNFLRTTSGIEYSSLVNLYLAENQITQLKGLQFLVNLERLHLRDNPLYDLTGFSKSNIKLKYLNIRQCRIRQVDDLKKLEVLTGLRELVVKGNTFNPGRSIRKKEDFSEVEEEEEEEEEIEEEPEDDEEIRHRILSFLPNLSRIDKKFVTKEEILLMKDVEEGSSGVRY